ncbi:MAG: DNA repair protein RecO [Thermodesulfobacteriota bacterium]
MKSLEAIVLRKTLYGEADYIVTFFTKELGKISGIARNAKNSKKRYGGRLEFFNHLKVDITFNENKFNLIGDIELKKSYNCIIEKLETFMIASFVMEHIDLLTTENEPADELFNETLNTLKALENHENILSKLLRFQINFLNIYGYKPDLDSENESIGSFSLSDGGIVDSSKKADNKNIYKFYLDIINNPESMDIFLAKVVNNIRVLTKYMEYHTGKQFKTSKFLEGLNL